MLFDCPYVFVCCFSGLSPYHLVPLSLMSISRLILLTAPVPPTPPSPPLPAPSMSVEVVSYACDSPHYTYHHNISNKSSKNINNDSKFHRRIRMSYRSNIGSIVSWTSCIMLPNNNLRWSIPTPIIILSQSIRHIHTIMTILNNLLHYLFLRWSTMHHMHLHPPPHHRLNPYVAYAGIRLSNHARCRHAR